MLFVTLLDFIDFYLVAIQCLEQVFGVDANSTSSALDCGKSLLDIFTEGAKVRLRLFF